MTMMFNTLIDDFDGFLLELFQTNVGLNPLPSWDLVETQTLNNGAASFDRDIHTMETFAVRVLDKARSPYLRSGNRDQSSGIIDAESGDFGALLSVHRGALIAITPDEVKEMISRPPILVRNPSDGSLRMLITSLELAIKDDLLLLDGTGVVFELPIGGAIHFVHEFRLKPETSPVNTDRILRTETVSTIVRSASGGILGFLTNFITQIIINNVLSDFVAAFERAIQTVMDVAASDQAAAQDIPQGMTISAHSITIAEGEGIRIWPLGLVMTGDICASSLTSGSVKSRPAQQVDQLRALRDKALRGTIQGEAYIEAFYANNPELVTILLKHPDILKQVDRVLSHWLKGFNSKAPGKMRMSPEVAKHWVTLLKMVENAASPKLATVVHNVIAEVETFIGRPISEVLAESEKLRRSS